METENKKIENLSTLHLLIERIDKEALFIQKEIMTMDVPDKYIKKVSDTMGSIRGVMFYLRDNFVVFCQEFNIFIVDILAYTPETQMTKEERVLFIENGICQIEKFVKDLVKEMELLTQDMSEQQTPPVLVLLYSCGGDILNYSQQAKKIIKDYK